MVFLKSYLIPAAKRTKKQPNANLPAAFSSIERHETPATPVTQVTGPSPTDSTPSHPIITSSSSSEPEQPAIIEPISVTNFVDEPEQPSEPAPPPAQISLEKISDLIDERNAIQSELITSEVRYAALLDVLVRNFAHPIKEKCQSQSNGFHSSDFTEIFANIEAIASFHIATLAPEMHRFSGDFRQTQTFCTLAPTFTKFCDFCKIYSRWVSLDCSAVFVSTHSPLFHSFQLRL